MSSHPNLVPSLLPGAANETENHSGSPVQALSQAFRDTVDLLFRPFDWRRWAWLSVICLFLGGGTASAAFNWSLGSLPGDIGLQESLGRVREYVADHLWLIILVSLFGLSAVLGFLYLRSVLRFVLVDTILRQQVSLGAAWTAARPLGRSYFLWLLATLLLTGLALTVAAVLAFSHFRTAAATGLRSVAFWVELTAILLMDIVVGLALALLITVTDDLVVPVMHAEGLPLLTAWRKVWEVLSADTGALVVYVLLRFAVAVAAGVIVLFFLFPILVTLFSGAIITGVLVVLALRLLGVIWSWNPLTVILASVALLLLTGVVLVLLSVVGMPGQVLVQDFGIRFIASRVPSLKALLRSPDATVDL